MKIQDSLSSRAGNDSQIQMVVDAVIRSRTAVRAYRPTPVSKSMLTEILDVARYAPSNSNTQPWFVHVLQGEPKRQLTEALVLSHERNELPASEHFPMDLPAACKDRQADFGARYYEALGIDRDDAASRYRQTAATIASSMRRWG